MRRKRLAIGVAAFIIAALTMYTLFLRSGGETESSGPRRGGGMQGPVPVRTADAQIRQIRDDREFTGTVYASYTYIIAAQVGGRLMNLDRRIGDVVGGNLVVGQIDDTEYRNSLREMEAQLRVSRASVKDAQIQLSFAERELERLRGLVLKGISSQVELETMETQLESHRSRLDLARAQVEQRQASLAQANTRLGYTQIRSSKRGLVAQRHIDPGAQLQPGSPILTIVGIDTVFVEIAVTERDYGRFEPGKQALVVVDAIAGEEFEGVVYRVAPFFKQASRTAVVEIAVPNDSLLLKPGMFARLSITLAQNDSALVVPTPALFERDGKDYVYTLTDSLTVSMTEVIKGIKNETWTEIVSPEAIEGPVVTLGQHLLRDGATVITEKSASRPASQGRRESR